MGLSALSALILLVLAMLAQSPRLMNQTGLQGGRLRRRARTFTSLAFAMLLLASGFFIAGVPINRGSQTNEVADQVNATVTALVAQGTAMAEANDLSVTAQTVGPPTITRSTPVTGAFGGPPSNQSVTPTGENPDLQSSTGTEEVVQPNLTPVETIPLTATVPSPSPSPTANPTRTPTITPSPIPSPTPFPTTTPTPVTGPTALVQTDGSTVWLKRSPGGQNIVLVNSDDLVLVLAGHANQGGVLWQEVQTLAGVRGWILESYLEFEP